MRFSSFEWVAFVASVFVFLTLAFPAFAESSVLLIVQGGIDQDPAPCELRLRSEFAAEGLEVVTASSRTTQNLIDLEGLARRTGAVAGLSVFVDVQSIDGRLWVIDPASRVDLVRTLHVPRTEADPVSVFALRAVEALRGARLELEQQKRKLSGATTGSTEPGPTAGTSTNVTSPAPATPKAADSVPVPQKQKKAKPKDESKSTESHNAEAGVGAKREPTYPRRWLVETHGVVGWELNDIGFVLGPGAEVQRWISPRIAVGLSFDGPLFSKLTPRAGSSVRLNQELLTVQLRYSVIAQDFGSLELVGITGASRFAVKGEAQAPSQGVSNHGFEALFGAGIGIGIPLFSWLRFGFDAQWLRRLPAPVIIDRQTGKDRRLTGDIDSLLLGKLGFGVLF